MIVDSSAIIAMMRDEIDGGLYYEAIVASPRVLMPAPIYVECCLVLTKDRSELAMQELDSLLGRIMIEIIPLTPKMSRVAAKAFLTYGKGRGHKAQLNFGDCISYAASKVEAMPLLFKGEDFALTDVEKAL
jgi:ribonuclease VapC